MKKLLSILWAMMLFIGFVSCSQFDEPTHPTSEEIPSRASGGENTGKLTGDESFTITKTPNATILEFESEEAYNNILEKISMATDFEEKRAIVAEEFPAFESMQDAYSKLIDYIDNLDISDSDSIAGSEGDILLRKVAKDNGSFYFPFYEEDGGPYIMSSNQDKAFLANINGDVKIAGKLVSCIDIHTYNELSNIGRTITEPAISEPLAAISGATSFNAKKNTDIDKDTSHGWREFRDLKNKKYKVKVNFKRKIKNWKVTLNYETCFRRKRGFFWCNTRLKTRIGGTYTATCLNHKETVEVPFIPEEGFSSHDRGVEFTVYSELGPLKNPKVYVPAVTYNLQVTFPDLRFIFYDKAELPLKYCNNADSGRLYPQKNL